MPRVNGFRCPMHPCQYLSIAAITIYLLSYATTVIPLLSDELNVAFSLCFFSSCFVFVVLAIRVTCSDPSSCAETPEEPEFFCKFCQLHVNSQTKHCSRCDRCVDGFDHHCNFFNNCIGAKNYTYFIETIVALEVFTGTFIAILIYLLAACPDLYSEVHYLIVVVFSLFCNVVTGILNGYIIGLHLLLKKKGMRTYQYIETTRVSKVLPDVN